MSCRFLTNHGRALLCLAYHPELRIRDVALALGITERSAQKIVGDLVRGGYLTRTRVGRRNRYEIHAGMPLPFDRELTLQDLLEIFQLTPREGDPAAGGPAVTLA
jgi:DNA-binding IclR family transcriptional regulator